MAAEQTAGRGRRGNSWLAGPGEGLLFSVVLRLTLPVCRVPQLALPAGLAVRDTVASRLSAPVLVKWPNDVLVGNRKIAGVLTECAIRGGELLHVVVGIGLNVSSRAFPPDLASPATSLALEGCSDGALEELLLDVLAALEGRLQTYQVGGLAPLLPELNHWHALAGRRIRCGDREGVAEAIVESGALRVVLPDGTSHEIASGHVELLRD